MMKRSLRLFAFGITLILVTGISNAAFSQSRHLTASNLGLGGGGTAWLDSYHANFVNPANLMLNEGRKPRLSIGLLGGVSLTAGGSLLNTTIYNEYFTGGLTLTNSVTDEALDRWFGTSSSDMREAGMELDVIPLGAAWRSPDWAASAALRTRVLFNTGVSRGVAELGLHGLDGEVFSEPRAVNMHMEALSFAELSAGFAMKILELPNLFGLFRDVKIYAGGAPKLLLGTQFSRFDLQSSLQLVGADDDYIEEIRHDFSYSFETTGRLGEQLNDFYNDRQSSGETPNISDYVDPDENYVSDVKAGGWGIDFGATVEMEFDLPVIGAFFPGSELLRVGASVTDLGMLTFSKNARRFEADGILVWEGFEIDRERIDEEFNGDENEYYNHVLVDSIGTELYGSFAPASSRKITHGLPTMANLGGQLILNRLSVSLDLGKGFVARGVNSKRFSLATGVEYRLFGFVPLRVGMHTGGLTSTSWSAGLGIELRNVEFSVGASTVRRSVNHGAGASAAWSGLVLRF